MRRAVLVVLVLATAGCARASLVEPAAPEIAISPGFAARIALMDRFRLHDEDRKRMMTRPRVWVEEVPEEEAATTEASEEPVANVANVAKE